MELYINVCGKPIQERKPFRFGTSESRGIGDFKDGPGWQLNYLKTAPLSGKPFHP
jgi:hypothetical protein